MGAQIVSLSNKDEEYNHSLVSATKSKRDQTLHLETANDVAYSPTNSQEYHLRSFYVSCTKFRLIAGLISNPMSYFALTQNVFIICLSIFNLYDPRPINSKSYALSKLTVFLDTWTQFGIHSLSMTCAQVTASPITVKVTAERQLLITVLIAGPEWIPICRQTLNEGQFVIVIDLVAFISRVAKVVISCPWRVPIGTKRLEPRKSIYLSNH